MAEATKKAETQSMAKKLIIAAIIIIAVVAIIAFMTRGRTTTTKESRKTAIASSLHCSASDIENEVFNTMGAEQVSYSIDAIFYDDSINNMTYTYTGKYLGKDIVNEIEPYIHGDFNTYMSSRGVDANGDLNVHLDIFSDQLQMTVSADKSHITKATAPAFMIKEKATGDLPSTLQEYKDNYTSQSFVCTQKNS